MKKIYHLFFLVLLTAPIIAGCSDKDDNSNHISVVSVKLDKGQMPLEVGMIGKLTATITPDNATNKGVLWTSDDTDIATVDQSGNVTAVKVGVAVITVKANDGGLEDKCTVTVVDELIAVTGVKIDNGDFSLVVGKTIELTATVTPDDASDKSVSWISDNPAVAEVDNNGKVTAKSDGKAQITVTTNDGGLTDKITVTVYSDVLAAISDPAFQAYAQKMMANDNGVDYPKWDTDGDGILSLEEAAAVKRINLNYGQEIDKKRVYVKSLEGLEYFTGLEMLFCTDNELTEIDVTNNTELVRIEAYNNELPVIDISNNRKLTHLYVQGNKIPYLDLTKAPDLVYLNCSNNLLTELDVSQNLELENLRFADNQLTDIDVSKNTKLTHLYMGGNQFTEIDVTQNVTLFHLYCQDNKITSLDVRNNTRLNHLLCQNNELRYLTVNRNVALTDLRCYGNHLFELDATVMDNTYLFTLYCGAQTYEDGSRRSMSVELQRKHEARWVQYFKDDELNKDVLMKFVD